MDKKEVRESNRQWAIRISEHRDSEKSQLDKMNQDYVFYPAYPC